MSLETRLAVLRLLGMVRSIAQACVHVMCCKDSFCFTMGSYYTSHHIIVIWHVNHSVWGASFPFKTFIFWEIMRHIKASVLLTRLHFFTSHKWILCDIPCEIQLLVPQFIEKKFNSYVMYNGSQWREWNKVLMCINAKLVLLLKLLHKLCSWNIYYVICKVVLWGGTAFPQWVDESSVMCYKCNSCGWSLPYINFHNIAPV